MQTKTDQIRAAIEDCIRWYAARSCNICTLTESINGFWIEIEYHTRRMEWAEARGMEDCEAFHLQHILTYLARIYAHAQAAHG